jgi:hypothetical protein
VFYTHRSSKSRPSPVIIDYLCSKTKPEEWITVTWRHLQGIVWRIDRSPSVSVPYNRSFNYRRSQVVVDFQECKIRSEVKVASLWRHREEWTSNRLAVVDSTKEFFTHRSSNFHHSRVIINFYHSRTKPQVEITIVRHHPPEISWKMIDCQYCEMRPEVEVMWCLLAETQWLIDLRIWLPISITDTSTLYLLPFTSYYRYSA